MDAFMKVRGSRERFHGKFGVESMVSRRMYSVGVDKLESVASPSIDTSTQIDGVNEVGNSVISLTSPSNPSSKENVGSEHDAIGDVSAADPSDLAEYVPEIVLKSFDELTMYPQDRMIVFLDYVQANTGLAWWETIACTTIFVRLCILPLAVEGMKRGAKMQLASPDMVPIQQNMERIKKTRALTQEEQMQHAQEIKAVYKKHGASPLGPIVPVLLQMPIFMSFFFALRKLHEFVPELKTGGFGPYDIGPVHFDVTDLTQVDTSYVLPVALTISFLAVIEAGGEMADKEMQKKSKNVMRFLALFMFGVSTTFPASVTWYWTVNNSFSFFQSTSLQLAPVRQMLGLPMMSELQAASKKAMLAKGTGVTGAIKAPKSPINPFIMSSNPAQSAQNGVDVTTDDKGNPTFAPQKEVEKEAKQDGEKINIRKRHRRRKRK
eukprot:g4550.t1